ncbi:hypothetical protein H1R88_00950, partial [Flavobacterium psychrophilum]
KTIIVQ